MKRKRLDKTTIKNVLKVFRVLRKAEAEEDVRLHNGEVARRAGLHPWVVSKTVDRWLAPIVNVDSPEELKSVGITMKFYSLRNPNLTETQVLRVLQVRRML